MPLVSLYSTLSYPHWSKQGKSGVAPAKSVVAGVVVDRRTDDLVLLVDVEAASYFGRVPLRMFE